MKRKQGIAVITGGTSGLGLAIARNLLKYNYTVYALGTNEDKKKQIELEFKINGSQVCMLNLMNEEAIRNFCASINEVHIIILCAGILRQDTDLSEEILRMWQINLLSHQLLINCLLTKIPRDKNSWIWAVTSSSINKPYLNQTQYASTKLQLQRHINELREQLAYTHPLARVTEIIPGGMLTNFHAKAKLSSQVEDNYMSVAEIAQSACNLLLNLGESVQIPYVSFARRPNLTG
ncbi:SDR family NAD(P)-dependent oxidoreductase [Legionella yabuuchiae]|uniref:SDR family NAD(P)-dependent oxidoreductase n=1 Tax=Legionella yabuuchiae TaxID=376727 RepID=UPI0010548B9C|nr:SDR family NAD(P)-dependent oxidoreductase [Legionella yabuuchiae]